MNKWFRRAVGTVGVAGGIWLLGAGTAGADDAVTAADRPQLPPGLLDELFQPTGGLYDLGMSTDTPANRPMPQAVGANPVNGFGPNPDLDGPDLDGPDLDGLGATGPASVVPGLVPATDGDDLLSGAGAAQPAPMPVPSAAPGLPVDLAGAGALPDVGGLGGPARAAERPVAPGATESVDFDKLRALTKAPVDGQVPVGHLPVFNGNPRTVPLSSHPSGALPPADIPVGGAPIGGHPALNGGALPGQGGMPGGLSAPGGLSGAAGLVPPGGAGAPAPSTLPVVHQGGVDPAKAGVPTAGAGVPGVSGAGGPATGLPGVPGVGLPGQEAHSVPPTGTAQAVHPAGVDPAEWSDLPIFSDLLRQVAPGQFPVPSAFNDLMG